MMIDRHNYEEFFILYWDNELNADQKKAVEEFVHSNTDLKEEFSLLGKTRFSPEETLVFENKQQLVRTATGHIDHSNYEEFLLSYVDGELNTADRNEFEKFLEVNPSVRSELSLLQTTKFHPEQHIVFPDKSVLYRKEEKKVHILWLRMAAAAAILITAGIFTFNSINNSVSSNDPAVVNNQQQSTTEIKAKNDIAKTDDQELPQQPKEDNNEANPENNAAIDSKAKSTIDQKLLASENNNVTDVVKNNEKDVQSNTFIIASTDIPSVIDIKRMDETVTGTNTDAVPNISFTGTDVTQRNSPALNILEGPEETVKGHGGLKGFLRKATRVFEKRTNIQTTTDDDKLLIGAFAVSLK